MSHCASRQAKERSRFSKVMRSEMGLSDPGVSEYV